MHEINFQQEAPAPPAAQAAASTSSRKKKNQYQKKRTDEFRERKGASELEKIRQALNEKLFIGFSDVVEGIKSLTPQSTPLIRYLPVTTRGIGFIIQSVYNRLARQINNLPDICDPYSIYRITLLQLEYKIAVSRSGNTRRGFTTRPTTYDMDDEGVRRTVSAFRVGIGGLANIVNSVGVTSVNGNSYMAVFPTEHGFHPENVRIINLRDYVEQLASVEDGLEIRTNFYEASPLPFAHWSGMDADVANPHLVNGDAIMPRDYVLADVRADIDRYKALLDVVQRKYPKYLLGSTIDYEGPGHPNMLISSRIEDSTLRNPDTAVCPAQGRRKLVPAAPPIDLRSSGPTQGELSRFYAMEDIDMQEQFVGSVNLLGEWRHGAIRHPEVANRDHNLDWQANIQAMFS